jgi:Na+/H+ antiporter NhaD/arsenite permease-like protein
MPSVNPVILSDARTVAAYAIFAGSYVVFALGKFPGMKIDRPGAGIIGAVLMVAFGIVGAPQALASIDFGTVVLLFSMMVIVAHLRVAGFFDWITDCVIERLHPHHLLPTVIGMTGVLSAFLVNDIVCLMMTPLVVHMARRLRVDPVPYLLAVATASNIGSTATITGNPQNMLIGSMSGVSYLDFVRHLGPVALAGLCANWAIIHYMCLRGAVDHVDLVTTLPVSGPGRNGLRKKPVIVLSITVTGFVLGVPPALMAATGAALLLITRTVEPRQVYDDVDWGLLVFFIGLFVIVGGADRAGLTATLLGPFQAWDLHRIPIFVSATAALSNVVSNVPAVMLLRTVIPTFPDPHIGWLTLAMASTLAGNLTITGSVANIIVVERAAAHGVSVDFREYLRVGLPVTIATLMLGAAWLLVVR